MLLGGYHPFAEDGGLYLAGVRWELDHTLYRGSAPFVTAHLRYSLFAPGVAAIARATGLPLDVPVLALYLLCLWATLGAAWLLARELFATRAEWIGATAVLAAGLAIPVAGTSLVIADPYLTARSVSTVGCLLGLVAALRFLRARNRHHRRQALTLSILALAAAAAFHPLMAGYGVICTLLILVAGQLPSRHTGRFFVCTTILAILLCVAILMAAPPEDALTREAALTRSYWFLSEWRWYELAGLWAPALLLLACGRRTRNPFGKALTQGLLLAGTLAVFTATLFARPGAGSFAVARLQPLRLFQLIYIALFLFLGASLGRSLASKRQAWLPAALALAAVCAGCGWATTPDLPHLQLPWTAHTIRGNDWTNAFVWLQRNTAPDALVALDADYISAPGEDAENFRAVAQRSSLPDAAKDGGEAAITPRLAAAWSRGVHAQQSLSTESDTTRRQKLLPLGVGWLVLQRGATTALPCPFRNHAVLVCRLTPR